MAGLSRPLRALDRHLARQNRLRVDESWHCDDCGATDKRTLTIKDERDEWVEVCDDCFRLRKEKGTR